MMCRSMIDLSLKAWFLIPTITSIYIGITGTSKNLLRRQSAALGSARNLAYLTDMSRLLRAGRLASCLLITIFRGALISIVFLVACTTKHERPAVPLFDKNKAYAILKKQIEFGPRVPGTEGHTATKEYLSGVLSSFGLAVQTRTFTMTFGDNDIAFTNISAQRKEQTGKKIILAAHWDTRPFAEKDKNWEKQSSPIDGANDGGSGVAVLLEIARHVALVPPLKPVEIILFDGEDYGRTTKDMFLGSSIFAQEADPDQYDHGILIDMIGDADLAIYQEKNSLRYAPEIVDEIFKIAATLGLVEFIAQPKFAIEDDHIPLNKAGIPCIDLIDFDYPPWHTTEDTLDKISADSLLKVGSVLLHYLYKQ